MGGIIRGEGGVLLAIGGMPDHVHLLAKLKTKVTVSRWSRRSRQNPRRR
ncbi:MAG TPA: transposase [Thermoanaerobaculia bacterium]